MFSLLASLRTVRSRRNLRFIHPISYQKQQRASFHLSRYLFDCPYTILGITKTASQVDIKKAYRKKAMEHHPDRNDGSKKHEEIFKKVTEAYTLLSNEKEKRTYDMNQRNTNAYSKTSSPYNEDFDWKEANHNFYEDIFNSTFGGNAGYYHEDVYDETYYDMGDFFGDLWGKKNKKKKQQSKKNNENSKNNKNNKHQQGRQGHHFHTVTADELHVDVTAKLTLEDLFNGTKKAFKYNKNVICPTCDGVGSPSSKAVDICTMCDGSGIQAVLQEGQLLKHKCYKCRGNGIFVPIQNRCKTCKSARIIEKEVTTTFDVSKGSVGQTICLVGEGHQHPNAKENGNVHIHLEQQQHKTFKATGSHLFMTHKLTLVEALSGFQFHVELLSGDIVLLKSNPNGSIVHTGDVQVVKNEGMPKNKYKSDARGDLYIKFEVELPKGTFMDISQINFLAKKYKQTNGDEDNNNNNNSGERLVQELAFTDKPPKFPE